MGSNNGWDAEEMFQKYLHDYLVKKNMHKTAEIFAKEANADLCPVAIDSPEGFLVEWWSVFYDVYFSVQSQDEEAVKRALNKGKQVTVSTAQNLCPEKLEFEKNQLSTCQFPIGSNVGDILSQPAPKTREEGNHKSAFANLQFINTDHNHSKSVVSSQSNPQRQPHKQAQQRQEKKRAVSVGNTPLGSSVFGGPTTIDFESSPNATPLKGWPLIGANLVPRLGGNQVLNSCLQTVSNQLPIEMPELHNSQELFAQLLAAATEAALSPSPVSPDLGMLFRNGLDGKPGHVVGTGSQNYHDSPSPFRQNVRGFDQPKRPSKDSCDEDKRFLDESIEKFLSHYDDQVFLPNPKACHKKELTGTDISLAEVGSLHASKGKVFSCNFSPDGKWLASSGQDKKVFLWNMDTLGYASTLESHSQLITEVQFHPSSKLFATSSFDKSVQVWDSARPNSSLFTLFGHTDHVMSLDFHPRKTDLLCSCDSSDEIRLWNVKEYACLRVSKGAIRQLRFQPQLGRLLATAAGNGVNIFDVETGDFLVDLKGFHSEVRSISWDVTGKYLASVSEETVRLWSVLTGGQCIYEIQSKGNNFQSCTFHPGYPLMVVLGCYQSLCLWNPSQSSAIDSFHAHNGLVASLASSPAARLLASASHDQCLKLWR